MYTLPDSSSDTSVGKFRYARVAANPSPLFPVVPKPAIVVMTPVNTVICVLAGSYIISIK